MRRAGGAGSAHGVQVSKWLLAGFLLWGLVLAACSGGGDSVEVTLSEAPTGSLFGFGESQRASAAEALVDLVELADLGPASASWEGDQLVLVVDGQPDQAALLDAIEAQPVTFRPVCAELASQEGQGSAVEAGAASPPIVQEQDGVGCEGIPPAAAGEEPLATTPRARVNGSPAAIVIQPGGEDGSPVRFLVGRPLLDGDAIENAAATFSVPGDWVVFLVFRPGAEGIDLFNSAAAACFSQSPQCPTGRLAVVWNGEVVSAPTLNASEFARDQISISGGFDESSANRLAGAIVSSQVLAAMEVSEIAADD